MREGISKSVKLVFLLNEYVKLYGKEKENAFYNKENFNPDIHGASGAQNNNNNNMISVPEGVDADMLMMF